MRTFSEFGPFYMGYINIYIYIYIPPNRTCHHLSALVPILKSHKILGSFKIYQFTKDVVPYWRTATVTPKQNY